MFEIDFLWVGEETQTGDAIACRFTHPTTGAPVVVIIDGGFTETGDRIVEHVRSYYRTDRVDLAICTHPDDDHIRGLFAVVEGLNVERLLIHRPSVYGFVGDDYKSPLVEDLVLSALSNGTQVETPDAGTTYFDGALTVVGPSESDYVSFLSEQAEWHSSSNRLLRSILGASGAVGRVLSKALAGDPGETLDSDNGGTTPRNNTSIIVNVTVEGYRALFTGDAGAPALTAAADYMDAHGLSAVPLDFFQVPHHGSRHNLTRELCQRLLGPIVGDRVLGTAYVSVGKKAEEHPRPEVANACKRRGYPVYETRGRNIWWHRGDAPARATYSTLESLGWLDED